MTSYVSHITYTKSQPLKLTNVTVIKNKILAHDTLFPLPRDIFPNSERCNSVSSSINLPIWQKLYLSMEKHGLNQLYESKSILHLTFFLWPRIMCAIYDYYFINWSLLFYITGISVWHQKSREGKSVSCANILFCIMTLRFIYFNGWNLYVYIYIWDDSLTPGIRQKT